MPGRGEMLSALILVVMALFVASGQPFAGRRRRLLRLLSLIVFGLAVGAALIEVAMWLGGRSPS